MPIDLRSDFLTRPIPAMVESINRAALEPSEFGLRDDIYVRQLEEKAAALLGKEDALFCPTCTLANQIAINILCPAGGMIAAHEGAHIFTSEAGAYSALSGAQALRLPGDAGVIELERLAHALRPGDALRSEVGLLALENTHVGSGGRCVPRSAMSKQFELARAAKVPVHLDGARLPNAARALDVSMATLASFADSVSLSLNKGLGAPMGAILAGTKNFVVQAERIRQRFGGGWRPAGILAAPALLSLENWHAHIDADHRRARQLAQKLAAIPDVEVDLAQVETNLLLVGVTGFGANALSGALRASDVLSIPYTPDQVRLAIYRDITDVDIEEVARVFETVVPNASAERDYG